MKNDTIKTESPNDRDESKVKPSDATESEVIKNILFDDNTNKDGNDKTHDEDKQTGGRINE
jgi:hypothetical protein